MDEIKEALTPVFRGYVVRAPQFEPGLDLYRARLMAKPQRVSELLYPPVGVAPLGRVNQNGESVLYCATARSGLFFELAPQVGDALAIAKWTSKPKYADSALRFVRAEFARVDAIHDFELDITILILA